MDWKKSFTQSRQDAKNTNEVTGLRLVGLRSKTSLDSRSSLAEQEHSVFAQKVVALFYASSGESVGAASLLEIREASQSHW